MYSCISWLSSLVSAGTSQQREGGTSENNFISLIAVGTIAVIGTCYFLNCHFRKSENDLTRERSVQDLNGVSSSIPKDQDAANAEEIAAALTILSEESLLTPENREAVENAGANAKMVAAGLICLNGNGILTPENREAVENAGANAKMVAIAFNFLKLNGLSTPENRAAVSNAGENAVRVAVFLKWSNERGFLTPENRDAVANMGENTELVLVLFEWLNRKGLLTPESLGAVAAKNNTRDLLYVISNLIQLDLLTQENFNFLMAYDEANIADIANAIWRLQEDGIVTEDRVLALLAGGGGENAEAVAPWRFAF